MDRDIHAAQCMVWMAENGYDNTLLKKKSTMGRGDVKKQTSAVKGYGGNTITDPCCLCGDSKSVSMKHEINMALAN